ncbi:MAG: 16S rRNA (uracil(1498)-N(3))-methyltransferase [Candidatus Omnitrophica bacterium]|nr:16S rRNA (uracil(1498)-N(3))-methyltransferase [Candidatus Omnitrophota bacterium]
MSRFFVPKQAVKGNRILISGSEAHHILDVMRLKVLDKVVAFDGTGKEYVGFIKDVKRKSLVVEVVETRSPLSKTASRITLIQAIPKKDKMDYIVEKATELGVDTVLPVMTKRTIVRWDERKSISNVSRWKRIALEASKQCGRRDIPRIGDVKDFEEALKNSSEYDLAIIAALTEERSGLKDALKGFGGGKIAIAIGPEGDFTPGEVGSAIENNFKPVSLGSRVLKSDTAAVAALSILNYEFTE